jgi:hypothetical protein
MREAIALLAGRAQRLPLHLVIISLLLLLSPSRSASSDNDSASSVGSLRSPVPLARDIDALASALTIRESNSTRFALLLSR